MRLFRTVLLSTTLMMGVTFGADALSTEASVDGASHGVKRSDAQVFADTLAEIRAENAQYLEMIKKLVSKVHTGEVTLTDRGEFVDYIAALAKGLNAALKAKATLEADLSTATGRVTTIEAENAELTKEKAKTEAALKETSDKLSELTAEKNEASRQLEAARAEAVHLVQALAAAEESAKKAGEDASGVINGLEGQLAKAQGQVRTLIDKVAEFEALKVSAEKAKREKEAGLRALKAAQGATERAVKQGQSAGVTSDFDPLEHFDLLQTGAEEEEMFSSPRSLDDASPLQLHETTPLREIRSELDAAVTPDAVVHTGAGLTVVPVALDAKTATKIIALQTALATAQEQAGKNDPWSGSPEGPKKNKDVNRDWQRHLQIVAAKAEVTRITAELKKLGVNPITASE